jgi:hypothetical protein
MSRPIRKLRIMLHLLRRRWRLREKQPPPAHPITSIDPREFSDLLRSGRKQDLKTLAKKLSDRRRFRV